MPAFVNRMRGMTSCALSQIRCDIGIDAGFYRCGIERRSGRGCGVAESPQRRRLVVRPWNARSGLGQRRNRNLFVADQPGKVGLLAGVGAYSESFLDRDLACFRRDLFARRCH